MRLQRILSVVSSLAVVTCLTQCVTTQASTLDTVTKGSWIGEYGEDGYILSNYAIATDGGFAPTSVPANDVFSLPSYISSYSYDAGFFGYTWDAGMPNSNTQYPTVLQDPLAANPATDPRNASTTASGGTGTVTLLVPQPAAFYLSVYGLDFDAINRNATVTVTDDIGSDTATFSQPDYTSGIWANFLVVTTAPNSQVTVELTFNSGVNGVISGIMFDPVPVPEPSTFALLGLGAIGLAVKSRRRGQRAIRG